MQEFLEQQAKLNGKSLKELREIWKLAKKQASKKGLKLGSRAHTQHVLGVVKLLAGQGAKLKQADNKKK